MFAELWMDNIVSNFSVVIFLHFKKVYSLLWLSLIDLHVSKFLVYVATGKSATAATITLTKVGTTSSHWKIKIREIGKKHWMIIWFDLYQFASIPMDYSYFDKIWNLLDCDSVLLPPDGCLQFHTGASGVIKSFNSDVTAPRLITLASSNLEYNICIRQEDGKLSISFYVSPKIFDDF